jgi:hypothetical protein
MATDFNATRKGEDELDEDSIEELTATRDPAQGEWQCRDEGVAVTMGRRERAGGRRRAIGGERRGRSYWPGRASGGGERERHRRVPL